MEIYLVSSLLTVYNLSDYVSQTKDVVVKDVPTFQINTKMNSYKQHVEFYDLTLGM